MVKKTTSDGVCHKEKKTENTVEKIEIDLDLGKCFEETREMRNSILKDEKEESKIKSDLFLAGMDLYKNNIRQSAIAKINNHIEAIENLKIQFNAEMEKHFEFINNIQDNYITKIDQINKSMEIERI